MLNKDSDKKTGEENWELVDGSAGMEEDYGQQESSKVGGGTTAAANPRPDTSGDNNAQEQTPTATKEAQGLTTLAENAYNKDSLDQAMATAEEESSPPLQQHVEEHIMTPNNSSTAANTLEVPHDSNTIGAQSTTNRTLLDGASHTVAKSFRHATRKIKKTVQDIDKKHKIQEATVSGLKSVGASAKALGENIHHETVRVGDSVKRSYQQNDVEGKAKAAAQTVQQTATTAGRKAQRFNDKYHVTEHIASAAVLTGAFRFSRGDARGGTSALAVAGASFLAGEAMRTPARARARQDTGLNEDLHMD